MPKGIPYTGHIKGNYTPEEFREKSSEELKYLLKGFKDTLIHQQTDIVGIVGYKKAKQLSAGQKPRFLKKEIARILTILRERGIKEA